MSEPSHRALRVFREAVPADAGDVRDILTESNLSLPCPSDRKRQTLSPIGQIFSSVCEQDGKVVAVVQWRSLGEELEILDLAVAISYRRSGVASFLLQNFLQQQMPKGAAQVFLEVRESNAAAIALYKNFGFSPAGRRLNYYRSPVESAVVMKLSLEVAGN